LIRAIVNGLIVTVNQSNDIYHHGTLLFENDTLIYVGAPLEDLSKADQVIDAKGNIVMPGLINTHGHGAMSLLRGIGDDLPLQTWLEKKIWPIESQFTEEHIYWGSKLSIIEMLKSGTTTYLDMYIFMDVVAETVKESRMRATLTRGMIGFGSTKERQKKLKEAVSFAKKWNHQADGLITTMMSPHSAYTCSPDFIQEIVSAAKEIESPIHIHMSETAGEVEESMKRYGLRPVEHLLWLGVFDLPALVAHAVHVNKNEINILFDRGVKVSHNPGSNLKLGSGIAPVADMLKQGITVSLGTDGAASNNNLDLFEEMRLAALIHKGFQQDPLLISANTALQMATINGAKSLFLQPYVGSLEPGKKADFIILDSHQAHFHPLYDPISHIVYSASGKDVLHVFINGEQVVKDGEVLTLDEEKVIFEVEQLTKNWRENIHFFSSKKK